MTSSGCIRWLVSLGSLLLCGSIQPAALQAAPVAVAADTFVKADGEACFAIGLSAPVAAPPLRPHDIVVLFDTSASQAGEHREQGLQALDALLTTLADRDQVRLLAVDVSAVPLTESFVAVGSDALKKARQALQHRVPLGATDMDVALDAALGSFAMPRPDRAAAVVYLGDGMSTAGYIPTARMQQLVQKFVAARVAVSSYGFGPRVDALLLGVLANHTGGMFTVQHDELDPKQIGMQLAGAADGEVLWPVQFKYAATLGDVYPRQLPPLRLDRDNVLVGRSAKAPQGEITLQAELAGKQIELAWNVTPQASSDENAYLSDLVIHAKKDGGLSLPLAGSTSLKEIGALSALKAHTLVRLAQQALATGSVEHAVKLSDAALKLDPANAEAQAVRKAAAKGAVPASKRDLKLVNFQVQDNTAVPPPAAAPAADGDFLREVAEENKRLAAAMRTAVMVDINSARTKLGSDPNGAISILKLASDRVHRAAELSPDDRTQLNNQIESALRDAYRKAETKSQTDVVNQEIEARRREREQLVRDLYNREEKTKQLMDRFANLMDERKYAEAEQMAELAKAEFPNNASLNQAPTVAFRSGYVQNQNQIRAIGQRGWTEMMQSLARTGTPFSDDPPVIYPDAETWRLMSERRAKYKNVDLASKKSENEKKIIAELTKDTDLEFPQGVPLSDVVASIAQRHKIPILFDTKAIQDGGAQVDAPLAEDISLKGVTLRSALRVLLKKFELTYLIKDDVMQITTKAAAEDIAQNGVTKVYPVADLVVPIPQGGLNGFGSIGGMGGGLGGSMGGGMGGGGGGMGGGFGGGGGGGMFAVPDDLKLSSKKPAPAVAPAAAIAAPAMPVPAAAVPSLAQPKVIQPIQIEIAPGQDIDVAWNEHFAKHEESSAAVRETVRRLMGAKKYDHVIALVYGAIRNSQAQPWMYEALGIAMQTGGAPPQDIERAMMSAVDFSTRTTDLIHVAEYLLKAMPGNQTIERRALKLYQQVAQLEPTQPESHVQAMLLAQRLNDFDAVQSATVGILSQAWPNNQKEIPTMAQRVAAATWDYLRTQKRTAEADRFKKAIDEAMIRDVKVVVSWTGHADIDLLMEEPAGSVCSFRSPRTTSGGVMLGDSMAGSDDRKADTMSETYICPQGFDGLYKMQLRRVFGKTTVDKATVEYIVHAGTPKEQRFKKQVALVDGEATAAFELKNGRRTEPLEDQQVANAVAGQMAIGQSILAQQIGGLPQAGSLSGIGNNRGLNSILPMVPRGAVGYMPIIITLPEGVNMSAVAVVSADRRYVRCTTQPLFSQIPKVNTFNYVSGSSGTSNGGTGT